LRRCGEALKTTAALIILRAVGLCAKQALRATPFRLATLAQCPSVIAPYEFTDPRRQLRRQPQMPRIRRNLIEFTTLFGRK
jgi:hypothetical protein